MLGEYEYCANILKFTFQGLSDKIIDQECGNVSNENLLFSLGAYILKLEIGVSKS